MDLNLNTIEGIQLYLTNLTDQELVAAANEAHADLKAADVGSERQGECFAGLHYFVTEMSKRGLKADSFRIKEK